MEGLHYTMGVYQITDEERSITEVLDDLLDQQLNDLPQIEKYVAAAKKQSSTLVDDRVQISNRKL